MSGTKDRPRPSPRRHPSPRPRDDGEPTAAGEDGLDETAAEEGTLDEGAADAAADDEAVDDGAVAGRRSRRGRRRKPDARATVLAVLVGCFVLLAAAAVWFVVEVDTLRSGSPDENAALADSAATDAVTKDVSAELKSVFSYNYTDLDRTERAADRALLDRARRQYDARFAEATDTAKKDELLRTASVSDIGVRAIDGDTAKVLVFLDQQTLANQDEQAGQQTISLDVVAKLVDGTWKIARFDDG